MSASQVLSDLSRLYALEVEAVQAYATGARAVGFGPIHGELSVFWLEHQRHVLELHRAMLDAGYSPPFVEPDVKGVVIGALTVQRRRLTLEDVLEGLRGNEQLTNRILAKVLAKPLPPEVGALVVRMADEERRHLEWLEQMVARRVWEAGSAAHP
jgi:hypothetical protein